jgi:hypothetical protein
MHEDPEGEWGSAWYYDDELIYVHKKFVAIPQASTTLDDQGNIVFDRTQMTMTAITYDDMRKGCWDRDERIKDMRSTTPTARCPSRRSPASAARPSTRARTRSWLACVEGQQRLDGRGVVRSVGRRTTSRSASSRLWDAELAAAETKRNAERGVRAIAFSEIPTRLKLPSINSGYWDPLWEVCNDYGVTVCMHVGSSVSNPVASPTRTRPSGARWASTTPWRRWPTGCSRAT